MSWVIAILLALILVALMASDKSASVAVKKVVRVVLVGVVLSAYALAILLFLVWFHLVPSKEDWWQTGSLFLIALVLAHMAWNHRDASAAWVKKDMWGILGLVGLLLGLFVLSLLFGHGLKLALEAYNLSGWWIIVFGLACPGVVLLVRTANSPSHWREVWNGPADVPEPWRVALEARFQAEDEERAIDDKETENWHDLTPAEEEAVWARKRDRMAATEARLAAILNQAEEAKARVTAERRKWAVRDVFWLFVLFGALGLVQLYWQYGFEWVMTWKPVKDREWAAGAIVIAGGFVVLAVLVEVIEGGLNFLRGRKEERVGAAKTG